MCFQRHTQPACHPQPGCRLPGLRLFNQLGQPAGQWRLHAGVNTFEVRHLPGGVYFYVLEEGGKVWQQEKVVRR
ncbi:MAG: hypothetical protein J5I98_03270 [Phaeodactylibacter sp.]|nr:hypothetical protein [Phaeodactylibacter sp.]